MNRRDALGRVIAGLLAVVVLSGVAYVSMLVLPGIFGAATIVLATGLGAISVLVIDVVLVLLVTLTLGRMMGMSPRLATLIGVDTAICGNTAIVATAPVIKANERDFSFAVQRLVSRNAERSVRLPGSWQDRTGSGGAHPTGRGHSCPRAARARRPHWQGGSPNGRVVRHADTR